MRDVPFQSGDRVRIGDCPNLTLSRGCAATVVRPLSGDFYVLEVDGLGIRCCTVEYLDPTEEALRRLEVA